MVYLEPASPTGTIIHLDGRGRATPWLTPDAGVPVIGYSDSSRYSDPMTVWRTQPSVRKVVSFAAKQVAQLPWHAYVRVGDNDRVRQQSSDLERVLRGPGRHRIGFHLWRDTVIDGMMYDRFLVLYAGEGRLLRLPPATWRVETNWLGEVTAIPATVPGTGVVWDLIDAPLALGYGWSPVGGAPISPLATLSAVLRENANAVQWRDDQWRTRPKANGILKRPADARPWNNEERDRFISSWREFRTNPDAGTPILEGGLTYDQLNSPTASDSQSVEGRQLTDVEVAAAFHIPPELVGAREGTFSSIAAYRQMLFGPVLGPLIVELNQAVNAGIVPSVDVRSDAYAEINRDAAIAGSLLEQLAALQTATGGPIMTRNEARARLNMPALAGGDELITPLNVTEGGQASPRDSGSQNEEPDADTRHPSRLEQAHPRAALTAKTQTEPAVKEQSTAADAASAAIRFLLTEVRGELTPDAAADGDKFHQAHDSGFADALFPHIKAAADAAADAVLAKATDDVDFDPDQMTNYLLDVATTAGAGVVAGIAAKLFGVTEEEAADALDSFDRDEAGSWGASVTAEAAGFGGHDAARAAGGKTKTWTTTSKNPRPEHAKLNGETVGIDETFSNGARWPGDANLDAEESAGCRCAVAYNL